MYNHTDVRPYRRKPVRSFVKLMNKMMKEMGMSVPALAKSTGLTRCAIMELKVGRTKGPNPKQALAIDRALKADGKMYQAAICDVMARWNKGEWK